MMRILEQDLLDYLKLKYDEIEIDRYNTHTREWSKGYKKGFLSVMEDINKYLDNDYKEE